MRPLVFLTYRSFLNGIKRALTSGKRLIGLLFFISYYVWLVFRPLGGSREFESTPMPMHLTVPPLSSLDAVVFAGFAFMSFILVMNVMGYRGGFKPADVD